MNYVSYQLVSQNANDQCMICLDPFGKEAVVAHEQGGENHPVHLRCIRAWVRVQETCIHCKKHIDAHALHQPLTLREKAASYAIDTFIHPYFQEVPFWSAALVSLYIPGELLGRFTLGATGPGSIIYFSTDAALNEYLKIFGGKELVTGDTDDSRDCRDALERMHLMQPLQLKIDQINELKAVCLRRAPTYVGAGLGALYGYVAETLSILPQL